MIVLFEGNFKLKCLKKTKFDQYKRLKIPFRRTVNSTNKMLPNTTAVFEPSSTIAWGFPQDINIIEILRIIKAIEFKSLFNGNLI